MVAIKKSYKSNSKNNPTLNLTLNYKKITSKSIIKVSSNGRRY